MNLDVFAGDTAGTGNVPVSVFAKLFPSAVFYTKMLGVYIGGGLRARKGIYSGKMWSQDSSNAIRNLESVGCRFVVEGMDNFKKLEGPCIFAGNHMSTLEAICMPAIIQPFKDVTFVVKSGLLKYPFFRDILLTRDPIVVDRKNPREDLKKMLEEGESHLKNGRSVIVFPQGGRFSVFDPSRFNSVAVKLAKRADVPIVPVALYTGAWSEGRIISDFGAILPEKIIRFRFGDPIFVSKGSAKEEHKYLVDFIYNTLREWDSSLVKEA